MECICSVYAINTIQNIYTFPVLLISPIVIKQLLMHD